MKYFTNNPIEREMMRKPRAAQEDVPPATPKGHPCYGCKRFGYECVRPCYRDIQRMVVKPNAACHC